MKVRALKLFNDLQSNKLRKVGEIFEATPKRLGELNSSRRVLVEVIEEDKKTEKVETKGGEKNGSNRRCKASTKK